MQRKWFPIKAYRLERSFANWKLAALVATSFVGLGAATKALGAEKPGSLSSAPAPSIQSGWVSIGDEEVHYLSAGPADGRVVVLLHGGRFQAEIWKQVGATADFRDDGVSCDRFVPGSVAFYFIC